MKNDSPSKLSELKEHLRLQSNSINSQRESKVQTVSLLISETADVQMMMKHIEETNRALARTTKRPMDFWLKNKECQEFFGVSDTTLRNWRHRGLIAYYEYGRLIMFNWIDIEKFLMTNRKEPFKFKK